MLLATREQPTSGAEPPKAKTSLNDSVSLGHDSTGGLSKVVDGTALSSADARSAVYFRQVCLGAATLKAAWRRRRELQMPA
eukprot:jgi/Chrzof1/7841/Cz02g38150.t1